MSPSLSPLHQAIQEMQAIYDMESDGDYYQIYQMLEQNLSSPEHEYLAAQEYCLHLICTDLAEHGDENLYLYAKGKIPRETFDQMYQDVFTRLIEKLKKDNATHALVWKAFGRVPLRIREALG